MQPETPQKSSVETVLRNAFGYWSRTLLYQFFFSFLYFSILFILSWKILGYLNLTNEMTKLSEMMRQDPQGFRSAAQQLAARPEMRTFALLIIVAKALLFPLNVGFFKIFRKMDERQPIQLEDFFAGYEGRNFFIFFGFALFWGIIAMYANSLVIPGILWILITVFCTPLMFFLDRNIIDSIRLSITALRLKPITVITGVVVAIFFSYFGLFFCGLGALLTFPFWNAMIYAMYQDIFREIKK